MSCKDTIEKEVKFEEQTKFEKLLKVNKSIFDYKLLEDYQTFCKNVLNNMDVHEEEEKNFHVKNDKNIKRIVEILKEETAAGNI